MKRAYDSLIEFVIVLPHDEVTMVFSNDWKFKEMLSWMLDNFSINENDIVEIRNSYIKRYKVLP